MNDKLLKIQSELKAPKAQTNSFGNYKYRSCEDILEAVKPLLKENELTLVLSDEVVNIGSHNYVKATAVLSASIVDSDESPFNRMAEAYAREAETKKGMDDAQITGAASSYARKYALNGLFAIDDTKDADTQDNKEYESKPNTGLKVTKKQLETLFSLAKQQGFTDQELALNWLTEQEDKDPREMSVKEASDLISKLMDK